MVVELFMVVLFHSGGQAKFCGFTEFHGGGGYRSSSFVRVCEKIKFGYKLGYNLRLQLHSILFYWM